MVSMLHKELLARVVDKLEKTMVLDWVVAMLKVELMTRVVAMVVTRVQDCVAAMMNTELLTRAVERMVNIMPAR